MLPAGLGLCCVSTKALEAQKKARANNPLRRCFFDFDDMLKAMRDKNYAEYKVVEVTNPNPISASTIANVIRYWGYSVIENNCMDHTKSILEKDEPS